MRRLGLLAWIPFLVLVVHVVGALFSGRGEELGAALREAYATSATVATIVAVLGAGSLAAVLGLFGAALFEPEASARGVARVVRFVLGAVFLAPLALPPVTLGGVLSEALGLGPAPATGNAGALARWAALAVVWGLAFAPLAALGVRAAMTFVPRRERRAAAVLLGRRRAFVTVVWPSLFRPFLFVTFAIAALAAADLVTPPHFGVDTFASRAAWRYATSLDSAAAAAVLLPMILALAIGLRSIGLGRSRSGAGDTGFSLPMSGAAAIGLVSTLLPAFLLIARLGALSDGRRFVDDLAADAPEALLLGMGAAFAAVSLALIFLAVRFREPLEPRRHPWTDSGFLTLALAPGLAIGLAFAALAGALPRSFEGPLWLLGILARVTPWALVVFSLVLVHDERSARALGLSVAARLRLAVVGPARPAIVAAAAAAVAASWREVDYFAGFGRPGFDTPATRAAQFLHFGLLPHTAGVMLGQILMALLFGVLMMACLRQGEGRR